MLVLERLHGSLLDYIVSVASDKPAARLAGLRKIAHQLLVSRIVSCIHGDAHTPCRTRRQHCCCHALASVAALAMGHTTLASASPDGV